MEAELLGAGVDAGAVDEVAGAGAVDEPEDDGRGAVEVAVAPDGVETVDVGDAAGRLDRVGVGPVDGADGFPELEGATGCRVGSEVPGAGRIRK